MKDNNNRLPMPQQHQPIRNQVNRQQSFGPRQQTTHHSSNKPVGAPKFQLNHLPYTPQNKQIDNIRQEHIQNNSQGSNTFSHCSKKQSVNQFESWKNGNNFQKTTPNTLQNNKYSPYIPRNQLDNAKIRKNSQVIQPTSFDLSCRFQNQTNHNKDFKSKIQSHIKSYEHTNKQQNNFQKPEVFQSMIIMNDNQRNGSINKMKNSMINNDVRFNASKFDNNKNSQSAKQWFRLDPSIVPIERSSFSYNSNLADENIIFRRKQSQQTNKMHSHSQEITHGENSNKVFNMKHSCFVGSNTNNNFNRPQNLQFVSHNTLISPKNSLNSPKSIFSKIKSSENVVKSRQNTPTKQPQKSRKTNEENSSLNSLTNVRKKIGNSSGRQKITENKQSKYEIDTDKNPSQNIFVKNFSLTNGEFKKRGTQFAASCPAQTTCNEQKLCGIQKQKKQFSMEDFQIIDKLGKGAFGDVFVAQQKSTKIICVLKALSKARIKQQNLQQHVLREIKIQSYLQHRHLVSLYGVFHDDKKIYLVMEYLNDGTLNANKKKISQNQTAYLIRQALDGLIFMHCQHIIHRDIKPENLFMFESYMKIGDFGCSVFSDSLRKTVVGCLAYISPEQLNNTAYDEKIDVWSVGVLTYELLMGKSPFEDDLKQMAKVQYQHRLTNDSDSSNLQGNQFPQLKFPQNSTISQQAQNFIKNLLCQNPQQRMTVKQAIKHRFIQKSWQWQKILEQKLQSL